MSTIQNSGLRVATAILAASFSLLAAPVSASAELDAPEESGRQDRIEHPYLGDIDPTQAAYSEAMDAKLGLWQ